LNLRKISKLINIFLYLIEIFKVTVTKGGIVYHLEFSEESKLVLVKIIELSKTHEEMAMLVVEVNALLNDIKFKGVRVGQALSDVNNIHLKGCYKVYCGDRAWRIVFEPFGDNLIRIHIIGLREKLMAYLIAHDIRKEYYEQRNITWFTVKSNT